MKQLYFYTAGLIVLLSTMMFYSPVLSAEKGTYIVDTPSLTVRSEPAENAEPIGYLQSGDKIAIFGTKFGWAQSYYDNKVAWVASQFLFPADFNNNAIHTGQSKISEDTASNTSGNRLKLLSSEVTQEPSKSESSGWEAADSPKKVKSETVKNSSNKPLDGYIIVLDPGHGGKDPGAVALDNTYEKNLNLATVQKTADRLKETGAKIIFTRNEDTDVSLDKRVKISNYTNVDAFISFHYNSSLSDELTGISSFYFKSEENQKFATLLHTSLVNHINLQNRGVIEADYRVLENNTKPAALVELGFLSNSEDLSIVKTDEYRTAVAEALTEGLLNYFEQK